MAEQEGDVKQTWDVRAGKGRKDEVGHSGIYPASDANAPADAEVVGQEELGHRSRKEEALVPDEDAHPSEPRRSPGDEEE